MVGRIINSQTSGVSCNRASIHIKACFAPRQWLLLKTVFLVPAKEANLILIFRFPYAFQSSLRVCISHVLTPGARLLAFCTAGRDSNFLQCWQSVSETASLSQNPECEMFAADEMFFSWLDP